MATVQECEQALHLLAHRLDGADGSAKRKAAFDRTLTCSIRDLGVIFGGRLNNGELTDIRVVESDTAQVRMRMNSDDLLALVSGRLNMATAWATGRVSISASVLDLMRLRSAF